MFCLSVLSVLSVHEGGRTDLCGREKCSHILSVCVGVYSVFFLLIFIVRATDGWTGGRVGEMSGGGFIIFISFSFLFFSRLLFLRVDGLMMMRSPVSRSLTSVSFLHILLPPPFPPPFLFVGRDGSIRHGSHCSAERFLFHSSLVWIAM